MDYHTHNNQNNQTWFLGGSIIFAGIIIAVAVLYAGNIFNPIGNNKQDTETQNQIASDEETKEILTVRQDDYVWGNPDASVKLFLFSDTECPYCKQYHMTLQTIMKTYKDSGKLAVVFRHFPLSIHPRAYKEAEALECAGTLAGNEAFWNYTDRLFTVTPSNNGLDPVQLPVIAKFIGLNEQAFTTCLNDGAMADRIEKHIQEGIQIGMNNYGTPYSIVVAPNGKQFPIQGAQGETAVRSIIEKALQATE